MSTDSSRADGRSGRRSWWAGEGGLLVVARDAPVPVGVALPVGGSLHCARMRGRDMADTDGIFLQFYEHLRLPDYFGWNWNALSDCLSDLGWIGARRFLIVVDEAEALLDGDPADLRLLLGALRSAGEYWSARPELPLREAVSFSTLLVAAPEACEALERAAAAAC